jgi:hypothetical protein
MWTRFLRCFGLKPSPPCASASAGLAYRRPAFATAAALLTAGAILWLLTGIDGLLVGAVGASISCVGLPMIARRQRARR